MKSAFIFRKLLQKCGLVRVSVGGKCRRFSLRLKKFQLSKLGHVSQQMTTSCTFGSASDGGFDFCPSSDMLQLINNQDMEFGGLFDTPYTGPATTQELPPLTQSITSAAPPSTTPTPPSTSSSSILSSSPHLDALLGPPITRSSTTPDKAFQPPTFQQSPLAQVSNSTPRQQPASPQQAQSLRQPQVEQPQPILSQSSPAQAASPHGSPGPNPVFSSTPQALFTSPAPQTPPQLQPQPQTQLQAPVQVQNQQQTRTTFSNPNSFTGKHSLMVMTVYLSAVRGQVFVTYLISTRSKFKTLKR